MTRDPTTPPPEAPDAESVVKVRLRNGGDFLDRYGRRADEDEVFLSEALDRPIGDEIKLDLYFDHSGYAFRVGGKVVSRRHTRAGELLPGARVVLAREDTTLRAMILSHARGEDVDYRARTGLRAQCDLPVRILGPWSARGTVIDLSPGGARIAAVAPPDLGVRLEFKMKAPRTLFALPLFGRVVWRRPDSEPLMGVSFEWENARMERKIRELVSRLING